MVSALALGAVVAEFQTTRFFALETSPSLSLLCNAAHLQIPFRSLASIVGYSLISNLLDGVSILLELRRGRSDNDLSGAGRPLL